MATIRKGQAPAPLTRAEFHKRFSMRFYDPAYGEERDDIDRIEEIAWGALVAGRKAPISDPAGAGLAGPPYEATVLGLDPRQRREAAQKRWSDRKAPSRILIICASARNDGTGPGEVSKTRRFTEIAKHVVAGLGGLADVLDLSLVTSEYGRQIHPCTRCVSSAKPLCARPCSCCPKPALGQADDWMAEIHERWLAAHGVMIVAPTHWSRSPTPLKLLIDRMVGVDGRNPDPMTPHGQHVDEARRTEALGWAFPKHVAGRTCGVVVHGDAADVDAHRRSLTDWLERMGMIDAAAAARLDRHIGHCEPHAKSHGMLDEDLAVQEEVHNVARSVVSAVGELRAGRLSQPDNKIN